MASRSRPRSSSATLSDVAARAGVSSATASRVLSNSSYGVKPELRERVLSAASALHYVPNAHARALARSSTTTVGVIVHDISDPYFADIVQGILEVAGDSDRLVMICHTDRIPARELEYLALLRAQQAEAVILASSGFDDADYMAQIAEERAAYATAGVALAGIGRHPGELDTVELDNSGGGYRVATEMLARGHRCIGAISGPDALTVTSDRIDGFLRGLADGGVDLPDANIVAGDFTRDGGAAALGRLLDAVPELTAVFALNDQMGIGALAELSRRGLRAPDDVSIVGFDNIAASRDTAPPLATVDVPLAELGRRALALALSGDAEPQPHRAEVTFVDRASLGPPRASR